MDRVRTIKDEGGPVRHSPNPMDPRLYLISTLVHDLRSSAPRSDSADHLITLAADENPNIGLTALAGALILHAVSPKLSWVAARLVSELVVAHRPVYRNNTWHASAQAKHRLEVQQRARKYLLA